MDISSAADGRESLRAAPRRPARARRGARGAPVPAAAPRRSSSARSSARGGGEGSGGGESRHPRARASEAAGAIRSARRRAERERERLEHDETEDVDGRARDHAAALRVPAARGARRRSPTTSTSRPPRSAAASCAPATRSAGPARSAARGERHRALVHVDRVNGGEPPTDERAAFDDLTPGAAQAAGVPRPIRPTSWRARSTCSRRWPSGSGCWSGRRPAPGRTTLLRGLAGAIAAPEGLELIVLLIDERPEEATAWREALPGRRDRDRHRRPRRPRTRCGSPSSRSSGRGGWPRPGADVVARCRRLAVARSPGRAARRRRRGQEPVRLGSRAGRGRRGLADRDRDGRRRGRGRRRRRARRDHDRELADPARPRRSPRPASFPALQRQRVRRLERGRAPRRPTSSTRSGGCARCSPTWIRPRRRRCFASGSRARPRTPSCSAALG